MICYVPCVRLSEMSAPYWQTVYFRKVSFKRDLTVYV